MEKRVVSTFVFPAVLGEQLRALRRREGLSIAELAHLRDRKPGFGKHLSQLERGRVRYPSMALVADYLRACLRATHRQACRASFADILPFLDRYTDQSAVWESRAREAAQPACGRGLWFLVQGSRFGRSGRSGAAIATRMSQKL